VFDPVMVATSGERLLCGDVFAALPSLIARADVLTPNLPEAAALLDAPQARDEAEMRAQAEKLLVRGVGAVLIKGGHAGGAESVDLLVDKHACVRLAAPRLPTENTHGTGCTFASAIAAGLAKGLPLDAAAREAKAYVSAAIAAADRLGVAASNGPLHHFYKWW
jgi:hydroxymethylpyrimidine/phosphomethylpyrimidine kinase